MRVVVVGGGALAATIAVIAWRLASQAPQASVGAKVAPLATTTQSLERGVTHAELSRAVARLERRQAAQGDGPPPMVGEEQPLQPSELPALMADDEKKAELARKEVAKTFEVLDRQLAGEPATPEWTEAIQREASSLIEARGLAGVSVSNIDCRTTLCELTIELGSPEAHDHALTLLGALPFAGGNYRVHPSTTQEGPPERLQVFASRPGTRPKL